MYRFIYDGDELNHFDDKMMKLLNEPRVNIHYYIITCFIMSSENYLLYDFYTK